MLILMEILKWSHPILMENLKFYSLFSLAYAEAGPPKCPLPGDLTLIYSYVPNKRRATLIFRTCFCLQCDAYLVPFYTETLQKINNIYYGYYGICYVWVLSAGNKCLLLIAQGVKWAMLISAGVPHMHPGVRWTPIISLTTTRRLFGDFLTPRRLFTSVETTSRTTSCSIIFLIRLVATNRLSIMLQNNRQLVATNRLRYFYLRIFIQGYISNKYDLGSI